MDNSAEDNNNKEVKRPSLFWLATEAGRALTELGVSIPFRKFYTGNTGDGHPILVLPGFMATDKSTKPLRNFLNRIGYEAYGWGLGRNYAKEENIELLAKYLKKIYKTHGEAVSIIGWSMGGIYARQLGKLHPKYIRQIITLGSPFRGVSEPNNVAWIYNLVTGGQRVRDVNPDLLADLPSPANVPTTAIYTKEDGIVSWKVCVEEQESHWHQNIQVHGSHLGLGVNISVLKIVADRLQYDKSNWVHFIPDGFMDEVLLYPSL